MLFGLFVSVQFICIAAEAYTPVFDQSVQNNVEHFWHSYTFNTGSGNREELHFSTFELQSNFKTTKNVFMWKSIQTDEEVAIIGLGNDFLLLTIYNKENDSVSHLKDLEGSPVTLTLFQKWSVSAQKMKNFALVAVQIAEDNYILKWYEIFNRSLKFLWDWPFYRTITHLDVIKIGHESKLLIINHNTKTYNSSCADIYNFNVNNIVDVWLYEKIILDDVPSSVSSFNINDNVFLSASFPSLETIHIFKYSRSLCIEKSEQKHFVSHQKIYRIGLKSLTSFQVGFRWFLAVASKISSIYRLTENFLFQSLDSVSLSSLNFWFAVPFDSYREDVILLAHSDSDTALVTWTGNENFRNVGSFVKLSCRNDTNCEARINKASLRNSAAFHFHGYQIILTPVENEVSLMFKFFVRLKPVPDEITVKLNEILKVRNFLEADFNSQNGQIKELKNVEKESSGRSKSVIFWEPTEDANGRLKAESQTKNFTEIMSGINDLKAFVESLNAYIRQFQRDLKSKISYQNEPKSLTVLPRHTPGGITFYGNVLINDLHLSVLNGQNVSEILKDSYRRNKADKLRGRKTLKRLNVENVMFEKLGDVLACDIIFSDDLCEKENKNIINGNVVFDGNLNVLNAVILTQPTSVHEKNIPIMKGLTLAYDSLIFDELEVDKETHIQGSINGELFILPVRNVHLNILDTVNQARVEVINVEKNLRLDSINGKNFSGLIEELALQNFHNLTIKLSGAFYAPALEVDKINGFDLDGEILESENQVVEKVSDHLVEYKSSFKKPSLKRTIHVFQNLNISGILISDRINNVSWADLKNTVKKGESNVTLGGLKKFRKIIKAPEIISRGTVNGRFVENVMNNFSNQLIWFPQTFDSVEFKILNMTGSWDGFRADNLNESFYRVSFNGGCDCNVTFKDECFVNKLSVEESVNEFEFANNKTKNSSGGRVEVKNINATVVVLHGSLVTNNQINLMNLTNFDMLRVRLKSPETIERDMSHYNITVGGDLNVKTLNLNDVDDVMISGGDTSLIEKFLNGDIHRIRKLLVKGFVETSRGINGFNLTQVFENGICIVKPGALKGNISFENIVNFNDINVTDSIDGFPLKKLEKDIVLKHSQVFLNGKKSFSTVRVTKNMRARSLNGHLVQEIVTLEGDHNMKGAVRVNGNVIVKGDITSYSAINNITVTDLLRTFSTRFNSYIYSGDLDIKSEKIRVKNLVLGECVQNVLLNDVINDSIKKEENFNASGKKSFNGKVTFRENIFVENSIQGLNFTDFHSDVVFINEPTKLEGILKVEEAVLKNLEVKSHFNSKLINKVDTNDWFEESIPLDKYGVVSGKKRFENPLVLWDVSVNFINNHLPSSMISLKDKQNIPVSVLFPKMHTIGDVTVSGSVNGRNLVEEFQNSVLVYGSQTISDQVLLKNEFTINGNLFVDFIKKKKVNDLITLDTDQKIRTPLTFKGLVTAKHNVENLQIINGIDIDKWNRDSVALNRDQVLSGFWTVKGIVKARNITGNGLLYEQSLADVSKDVHDGMLMALEMKNETETDYNTQCRKLEKLSREFIKLPYLFHQFEVTQEIETSAVIDSAITFKINEEEHLIISFINDCYSSLYKWNKENAVYEYFRQLNVGPASKSIVAYLNNRSYLVTISLKSSVACEGNVHQSNVWIFQNDHDGYVHLPLKNDLVDVVHENSTSPEFFSLDENGNLHRWTFEKTLNVTSEFLLNIGQNNYKFIDFRITNNLAVSNNREIRQFQFNGNNIIQKSHLFFNSHMLALPIDGEILTAVILKDKIVVYENLLEDRIFSVIHIYRAGSTAWFNYGPEKQAFLVVATHRKLIEVFEYKGVSGFVKTMSFSMFSSKLQPVILPGEKKHQVDRFLVVVQKKKLIFLRADMLGDLWHFEDSLC